VCIWEKAFRWCDLNFVIPNRRSLPVRNLLLAC
jgi:hypothetical protein